MSCQWCLGGCFTTKRAKSTQGGEGSRCGAAYRVRNAECGRRSGRRRRRRRAALQMGLSGGNAAATLGTVMIFPGFAPAFLPALLSFHRRLHRTFRELFRELYRELSPTLLSLRFDGVRGAIVPSLAAVGCGSGHWEARWSEPRTKQTNTDSGGDGAPPSRSDLGWDASATLGPAGEVPFDNNPGPVCPPLRGVKMGVKPGAGCGIALR